MYKYFVLFIMLVPGVLPVLAQQKFILQGDIPGLGKEMKVRLVYAIPHNTYVDSTVTRQGKFEFTGTISAPTKATLSLQSMEPGNGPVTSIGYERKQAMDFQVFYICAGKTTITGRDLKTAE